MASITAPGLGSGLDVNSIVSQLMALEQRPLVALQQKEAGYYAQLSALGQLRSAVSTYQSSVSALKSSSVFQDYSATSADTAKFTATADSTAAKGTYNIEVQTLAVAQKRASDSYGDSDTTTVGNAGDTMEITVDGNTLSVDMGAKTLTEIADAINVASTADADVKVTASILQVSDSSFRLLLTSDNTGIANEMTVEFLDSVSAPLGDLLGIEGTFLDGDIIQEADDADIVVDGYAITRSSNTITDVIEGVTLNLLETDPGVDVKLDVSLDAGSINSAVSSFVSAYNTLQGTLESLSSSGLSGDSSVRLIQRQVRSVFNTPPTGLTGSFTSLTDLGIEFQKDGTLTLDSTDLSDALASDLNSVEELFADDDQGYAFRLDAVMDDVLASDGMIDSREDGINSRVDRIQDSIEVMGRRLGMVESRLFAQFSAMDALVANLQSTGSFLTQQMDILNNLAKRNN